MVVADCPRRFVHAHTHSHHTRVVHSDDVYAFPTQSLREDEEEQARRGEALKAKQDELSVQNETLSRQLHDTELLLQKLQTEFEQQE